jgi:hypothetical protein
MGLTPLSAAYSSLFRATRHSHSAIFPITSPTSSRTADQTSAETKLAIWNGQQDISKMPAASGTDAHSAPKKRPMKIEHALFHERLAGCQITGLHGAGISR